MTFLSVGLKQSHLSRGENVPKTHADDDDDNDFLSSTNAHSLALVPSIFYSAAIIFFA